MKKSLTVLALGAAFCLTGWAQQSAPAAADAKAPTAQQSKMKACNTDAADKKGDERKAFMKKCLSATPQEKMKSCNAEAGSKSLKGDERKAFMKGCLSKAPA